MNNRITKTCLFIALITLLLFASCTKNDVTGLTLNRTTDSFVIGQKDSIIAKVTGDGNISKFPVSWTTSNSSVVAVVNGVIVGISKGTATITAKAGSITATCIVTVVNEIYPVINQGILLYYGDTLDTKVSNFFQVGIAGPVDTMYLFVNLPLTIKDNLPAGDYKFLTSIYYASDLVPNSIIPGELYDNKQEFSWYVGSASQSPIVEGDLIVSSINGIYSLEYNFIDYYGNTIFGTYQGSLRYIDKTIKSTSPAAKSDRLDLRQLKFISGKLKFLKKS